MNREFIDDAAGIRIVDHDTGAIFRSLGKRARSHIWPIEEYLDRTKHGRQVRQRLMRLNPEGKEEGCTPRGWHPHHRSAWGSGWFSDLIGRAGFEEKFGPGSYGRLPKEAFVKTGGKRKAVARLWVVEHGGAR
jgi:hypothetical protein